MSWEVVPFGPVQTSLGIGARHRTKIVYPEKSFASLPCKADISWRQEHARLPRWTSYTENSERVQ